MDRETQALVEMLETACNEHARFYKQLGGRNLGTKSWKNRIEWVERKIAARGGVGVEKVEDWQD